MSRTATTGAVWHESMDTVPSATRDGCPDRVERRLGVHLIEPLVAPVALDADTLVAQIRPAWTQPIEVVEEDGAGR